MIGLIFCVVIAGLLFCLVLVIPDDVTDWRDDD